MTAKSEYSSHSIGAGTSPVCTRAELTSPFRPSTGIHEIMRMMLEVRNGTVQMRNSTVCIAALRTWNARKYATQKPTTSVMAQTIAANLSVLR